MSALGEGMIEGHVFLSSPSEMDIAEQGTPVAGVTIELLDFEGRVITTTTTNSAGWYSFTSLQPGLFGIHQQQPQQYAPGIARAGSGGGSVLGGNLIADIQVASEYQLSGYNFWESTPSSGPIGGGSIPAGEIPIYQTFTGNQDVAANSRIAFGRPAAARSVEPVATGGSLPAARTIPGGDLLQVVFQTEPIERRECEEGGCGRLIDESEVASNEETDPPEPSSDPWEGWWEVARDDNPAADEAASSDEGRGEEGARHTPEARRRALEQLANDGMIDDRGDSDSADIAGSNRRAKPRVSQGR